MTFEEKIEEIIREQGLSHITISCSATYGFSAFVHGTSGVVDGGMDNKSAAAAINAAVAALRVKQAVCMERLELPAIEEAPAAG